MRHHIKEPVVPCEISIVHIHIAGVWEFQVCFELQALVEDSNVERVALICYGEVFPPELHFVGFVQLHDCAGEQVQSAHHPPRSVMGEVVCSPQGWLLHAVPAGLVPQGVEPGAEQLECGVGSCGVYLDKEELIKEGRFQGVVEEGRRRVLAGVACEVELQEGVFPALPGNVHQESFCEQVSQFPPVHTVVQQGSPRREIRQARAGALHA